MAVYGWERFGQAREFYRLGKASLGMAWLVKARNIKARRRILETIRFVVKGLTPMLMHSPRAMERSDGQKAGRKVIDSAEAEAEKGAYRLPNGDLCFPSTGVRNSILTGAKGLRVNRKAAGPFIAGALLPMDPFFPIVDAKGKPIREYVIDTQRAVIQKQGILRSRPRIDCPWNVVATFRFNPIVDTKIIEAAIEEAGKIVGLGDYRIEKKGFYGSYELSGDIEVVKA